MLLHQNKWLSSPLNHRPVTRADLSTDFIGLERKSGRAFRCQQRTDGETNKIIGKGHGMGLIEIVDAPDEPPFRIAPRAEIFEMEIADGKDFREAIQFRAIIRPKLGPAIISGAKKEKRIKPHLLMFVLKDPRWTTVI